MTSLQSHLDEFKKAFESGARPYNAPRQAIKTMHHATAELEASGLADRFHDEFEYRLPMPARYVIDMRGIIGAADVNADYTIRPEPSETVRMVRTLTAREAL